MPYLLKNDKLELKVDEPTENYNFSRFDWTGKITEVKFRNIPITTPERSDGQNDNYFGKALYNEFGIDNALGFEETEIGGWFHKIGVGLLKKVDSQYLFGKAYEIRPATFEIRSEFNQVVLSCTSTEINGYAYRLEKKIELQDSGFSINYYLQNTGQKTIETDEYVHNFLAINKDPVGSNYVLSFPFSLESNKFKQIVNPDGKVEIGSQEFSFNGTPEAQFFFSCLNGEKHVNAEWELINLESKIGIRETGNFNTNKVNLWGWQHVISPELFFRISVKPQQSIKWSRNYRIFEIT